MKQHMEKQFAEEHIRERERLLDAIGKIDEELVAGAAGGGEKKKIWVLWGVAAAACLLVVIFAGGKFILDGGMEGSLPENVAFGDGIPETLGSGEAQEKGLPGMDIAESVPEETVGGGHVPDEEQFPVLEPDSPEELPMLALGEMLSESAGFEGVMAHDISELTDANPWREGMELPALPVYENPLTYDEHYYLATSGADLDAMKALLTETADRLGLKGYEIGDNAPDEEYRRAVLEKEPEMAEAYFAPTAVTAEADGVRIEVDQQLNVCIYFEPEVELPEQYRFTYESSYEELTEVAKYLQSQYSELIGMEKPQVNIGNGDYTYQGQQTFDDLEFFDMAGSSADQILNYNFNRIEFCRSDEGKLSFIRIARPDLTRKVGNYPLISAEEAEMLLLNGNYITSVPYEMPGEDYIAKVELVYRHGKYDKYYVPYYRFYVELPEEEREHGLKSYGAYYVPAVEGSYISDMPLWDGRFN